jgi:hypothetical protein
MNTNHKKIFISYLRPALFVHTRMNSHLLPQNIIVSDGQAPDRLIRSEAKYLRPRSDNGKRREAITFSDFDIRSDEDIAFENTILADSDVRAYDAIRPYDNAIS